MNFDVAEVFVFRCDKSIFFKWRPVKQNVDLSYFLNFLLDLNINHLSLYFAGNKERTHNATENLVPF